MEEGGTAAVEAADVVVEASQPQEMVVEVDHPDLHPYDEMEVVAVVGGDCRYSGRLVAAAAAVPPLSSVAAPGEENLV